MSDRPIFREDEISQVPALQLLINVGWEYLSPEECLRLRGGKFGNPILDGVLEKQLRTLGVNRILYKGEEYVFSNPNVSAAMLALKNLRYDGLVRTNEEVYDLLSLGKSFEETIQGDTKSYTMNYIDWEHPGNNVYHVTEEYDVETDDGRSTRRPDIVLFVNGIPLCVIECKSHDIDKPLEQAISQHIRNQKDGHIPRFFTYPQLLLSVNQNEVKYGTVSTPMKFWAKWREDIDEEKLEQLVNTPLPNNVKDRLFSTRFNYIREFFNSMEQEKRQVTGQDRGIYSLCTPERVMELARKFIVFDAGYKKIARYQQYFTVNKTLERVKNYVSSGKRQGGVIWHTQGSGKSLLMVMLAKAITIDPGIKNPRVVVVTDRINLDNQIYDTFRHCGKEPVQARTGVHLLDILENEKNTIITTVIDKFEAAVSKRVSEINAQNIFVLVDESHRSQYGSANAMMERMLPKACYIGFTGTPLMKKEKNTAGKFGGFIEPSYTIDKAVEDGAIVPLLYEGRHVVQDVNQDSIDKWFERVCRGLSEEQKADLKKKFSKIEQLNQTEQWLYMVAFDINEHFSTNWKGTGYKGQIAAPSKTAAIRIKEFLDEMGEVTSEVVISGPDTREDHDEVFEETESIVQKFWSKTMVRFGNERSYNSEIISKFNTEGEPELVIVVSKLLTGFDAPRNTVLYIAKQMKEHTLLQAIARVNRVRDGKDYGYIIDYKGLLGELNEALSTYSALDGFDEEDLIGTMVSVVEEIKTLSQKHSDLWDVFKTVNNKKDEEEYELLLADKELRELFYDRLSSYTRTLGIALSASSFYADTDEKLIQTYKWDLKFFQKLRAAVKMRYAETIDFKEYESKVQKLLDKHVGSDDVIRIVEPVNIFDKDKFEEELARTKGKAARADMIAHRTLKSIEEKMEEDPVYYTRFSKLIKDAIEAYREGRLAEADYFNRAKAIMNDVMERKGDNTPGSLTGKDVAKAVYGVALDVVDIKNPDEKTREKAAEIALELDKILVSNAVVDWQRKTNIQNRMMDKMEDYLIDHSPIGMDVKKVDMIMERVMKIAKVRYAK